MNTPSYRSFGRLFGGACAIFAFMVGLTILNSFPVKGIALIIAASLILWWFLHNDY
jgi:hypothetical protein